MIMIIRAMIKIDHAITIIIMRIDISTTIHINNLNNIKQ
jgi:hypothetical protein